ncbi:hypothetical protein Bbelb_288910 [Branchiostoma belcheri]|nr:hypothetical protein Bbelb_288910 [Branchiostoma belcheri]
MSEEEQQSQECDTGATPMRQPESYWLSVADAAARIPNPMYASNAGTAPMQQPQSLRSHPDAAFHGLSRPYTRVIIGRYLAFSRRYYNTLTLLQHFNSPTASPGLTQESLSVGISPFPGATTTH